MFISKLEWQQFAELTNYELHRLPEIRTYLKNDRSVAKTSVSVLSIRSKCYV